MRGRAHRERKRSVGAAARGMRTLSSASSCRGRCFDKWRQCHLLFARRHVFWHQYKLVMLRKHDAACLENNA